MCFLIQNFNTILIILFYVTLLIIIFTWFIKFILNIKRNRYINRLVINSDENNIQNKKTLKKIDNELKETLGVWFELDLKYIKIRTVKESPDKRLAWFCFIEMMTRVVGNTFNEKGKCKDVLDSVYNLFKQIKKYTLENVSACNSAKISLVYMNKILRPFLVEWNSKINGFIFESTNGENKLSYNLTKEIENKFRKDFEKSYNELISKTKKNYILEKYCHFIGIKIDKGILTDDNGIKT